MTRAIRILTVILGSTSLFAGTAAGVYAQIACNAPDAPAWLTETRDREMDRSVLLAAAIEMRGDPIFCEGTFAEPYGDRYAELRFHFDGGLTYEVEVFPPRATIIVLRSPEPYQDEDAMLALLQELAADRGFDIDWSTPAEVEEREGLVDHRYFDPDTGLNASGTMTYRDGRLVAVRLSWAP